MNKTACLVGVCILISLAGSAVAEDNVPWGPPLTPARERYFHRIGLQIEARERRAHRMHAYYRDVVPHTSH